MAKQIGASNLGTPPDTYLYSLACARKTVATIGSDDSLRLFDAPGLKVLRTIRPCNTGVSCLTDLHTSADFATAGRDGLIRTWDSRVEGHVQFVNEPKGAGFSALASRGDYIAAGTESTKEGLGDVSVLMYDTRNFKNSLRQYTESHTDTITQLAFHPTQPNVLLSASTDGLVSLFDIDQEDEDDALQQVLNPRSAVHCAGFFAHDQVYVLTSDEHFSVYGLDKTGAADEQALPVLEYGDVREKLSCMYVIDVLKGGNLSTPVMAYGHNEQQTLSLMPLETPSWSFGPPLSLPGAHGEEVVRDVMLINEQTALTCGEDGQVRAWSLANKDGAKDVMEIDDAAKQPKKPSRKERKAAERFAPY